MKDFTDISNFFVVFFGQDSDEYGENYPEIVDSAFNDYAERGGSYLDNLISNIDDFRQTYPDNESAAVALNLLTKGSAGDTRYYTPTLLDFLAWLSAYLKQKRDE
ncbi:hypothetical protein ERHA55_39490 [Erwinia rhapontici]|uniref:CdiI immunity protein domain-containing protein n=1 Tax=Erwinia rhapontici TaxID=55212 RepID=A0ABN6DNC8_ERWRD|nr:hypothetical protein [Erwinia rhapontici]BCQ36162.1 hypothetical protein ERHA53_35050 [Erwinia rhapontici]BCQ46422.1 hypothetical protein ERHA55_39490 [Erwinia rhapontici]